MKRSGLLLIILLSICAAKAQHITRHFNHVPLSEALLQLSREQNDYTIIFIYNELEDFTVTKTVKRGRSLPDAVREVCGFYPVRVSVKGHDIVVECIQKDRTKLTGRLVGPDRQPVAYANITLSSPSDTAYLGGGVSNEAGDFVIPCGAERVRVRISCVGFKTIERVMTIGNVGTIHMQMEDYYLNNITVSGRMPIICSEADRLQYIVSNDEFARGLNAQELLSRVPMVTMNGSLPMILGKGPTHFMLNGRNIDLGDEAIQQRLWALRAEDIERIEVVSIPSGRYQTDAGNGYINIVMKRDQTTGLRGDLTGQLSTSDDWSGRLGGKINYTFKQFDISVGVEGGRAASVTNRTLEFFNTFQRLSVSRTESLKKDIVSNVMLRYQPHNRMEMGTFVSYQSLRPSHSIDNMLWIDSYQIRSRSTQHRDGNRYISLTAYSDWKLDAKGKLLSLTYNYYNKEDDYTSKIGGESKDSTVDNTFKKGESLIGESGLKYKIHSFKLDMSLPFKPIQLDAGVGYVMIDNESFCKFHAIDIGQVCTDDGVTISNLYQEKTLSAYLTAHKQWKEFAAKVGLRYEHTKFYGEDWLNDIYISYLSDLNCFYFTSPLYQDVGFNQSTDHLLPSLSLNYITSQGHKWGIQWGMSILRPNFSNLNPSPNHISLMDYSAGSPHLMPSYSNSIELNYQSKKGLSMVAYYLHGSNQVEWISAFKYSGHGDMTSLSRPENCFNFDRTGLSLSYQTQPLSQLNILAESNIYYYNAWIPSVPQLWNFENSERQGLHGWGGKFSLSADLFLNCRHTLMFSARFNQWMKHYYGLTKFGSYSFFYFALRYLMFDEHLKLSLVADDPFHQNVTDAESYYEHRVEREHVNHHSHTIGLTVSYSFGGKVMRRVYRDMKNTEIYRAEK